MKKVISIIVGILIVLAPTIALSTLWLYLETVEPTLMEAEIVSGVLSKDGEDPVSYQKGDAFFELLLAMHGTDGKNPPLPTASLPEEALSYSKYKMVYTDSNDMRYSYIYYISEDADKCYFTDERQRTYTVSKSPAEAFLNSDYAEEVYSMSAFPSVTVNGISLKPYTVDWNYKTIGGALKKASCSYKDKNISSVLDSFVVAFEPVFSLLPDEVVLNITNKATGEELYKGDIKGFEDFELDGFVDVSVDMSVMWKNGENTTCAGSANYFFDGRLFGKAAFKLNKTEATCGDVVILTAYNVMDASDIKVEFAPELNYTPVFYPAGDNSWQALLPLSYDLVSSKTDYAITMTTSTCSDIKLLSVKPMAAGAVVKHWSPEGYKLLSSASTRQALVDALKVIALAPSKTTFAGGKCVVPTDTTYAMKATFGDTVTITGSGETVKYVCLNNFYAAVPGPNDADGDGNKEPGKTTSVFAMLPGTVVYKGQLSLTGRIVAIDHGSGLISWYYNLSPDIAVSVGDTVEAGTFLAHAADGGVNEHEYNHLFNVGITVNGVPININSLLKDGLYPAK